MRPGRSLKGAGVPPEIVAEAARVRSTSRSNAREHRRRRWKPLVQPGVEILAADELESAARNRQGLERSLERLGGTRRGDDDCDR